MNDTINIKNATIGELQITLGKRLQKEIKNQGSITGFAEQTGLNRATLYHLLQGKNVGTDILIRVLRGLSNNTLLDQLVAPSELTPLEKIEGHTRLHNTNKTPPPSFAKINLSTGTAATSSNQVNHKEDHGTI
ncbi:MAG: hypothetical protein OCC49_17470 [Fibrobacterales bacterium]